MVVTDEHGNVLDRANDYIGEATNNEAEYRALLLGLERARALGAREVEVVNDSELVARQITGEYRVKKETCGRCTPQARAALRDSSAGRSGRCRASRTSMPTSS